MLTPIRDLFLKRAHAYHLGPVAEASLITAQFMKIVTEIFSNVSTAPEKFIKHVSFQKGALTVTVTNSAIAQELFLRSEGILHKLNTQLKKELAQKLKIKIG